ncbi:glycosyltransferase family 2 protein [Collinsella sp. SGI.184]|uniref:glycosyltransferase family 2 protein n=1 Tax=Collinsella sp. SGI.184 TaxID=3420556 RepID=UPI003D077B22
MHENNVDVSIIVSTYNHEGYLAKGLDSILSQKTHFDFEVIIADDCSSDGTVAIARQYALHNRNVKLIASDINQGNSRNTWNAIKEANGRYIGFLEGDDYWISDSKIEKLVSELEKDDSLIGASHLISEVNPEGAILAKYPSWVHEKQLVKLSDFLKNRTYSNVVTIYKNVFAELNLLQDASFADLFCFNRMVWDFTWCVAALRLGDVLVLPEVMSVYRTITAGNDSNYNSRSLYSDIAMEHLAIIDNNAKFYGSAISFDCLRSQWLFQLRAAIVIEKRSDLISDYKRYLSEMGPLKTLRYYSRIPKIFLNYLSLYYEKRKVRGNGFIFR